MDIVKLKRIQFYYCVKNLLQSKRLLTIMMNPRLCLAALSL